MTSKQAAAILKANGFSGKSIRLITSLSRREVLRKQPVKGFLK